MKLFHRAVWGILSLVACLTIQAAAQPAERAAEPFVLVVHPSTAVAALSEEQVASFFLKRKRTWPGGATVVPVDLPPESPVRQAFSTAVLKRSPSAVAGYWIQQIFAGRSEPPSVKATESAILSFVSTTPGAIGYVAPASVTSAVLAVKVSP